MVGELYDTSDKTTGALNQIEGVYCAGNAITGKGNIKASLKSAQNLAGLTLAGLENTDAAHQAAMEAQREETRVHVAKLLDYAGSLPEMSPDVKASIRTRIAAMQLDRKFVSYRDWRDKTWQQRHPNPA